MAPSKLALLGTVASVAAAAFLVRNRKHNLSSTISSLLHRLSSQLTIAIDEFDKLAAPNHTFKAAQAYLASKINPSTCRIRVTQTKDSGQQVVDVFQGIEFRWQLATREANPSPKCHVPFRSFNLTFHKKHKDIAHNSYLPYVQSRANSINEAANTLKLYANTQAGTWERANFGHPATFDMDAGLNREVMMDLDAFMKKKEHYYKVGKAWKRRYLLSGPPGTGMPSLIAAMAGYLRYNVCTLELTEVKTKYTLQSLLSRFPRRSILVVEGIDCTKESHRREEGSKRKGSVSHPEADESKETLSELLSCIDAMSSSSSGDGRIVIFTTNHKERINPALLRPGRMDVHICMSPCTPAPKDGSTCGLRWTVSRVDLIEGRYPCVTMKARVQRNRYGAKLMLPSPSPTLANNKRLILIEGRYPCVGMKARVQPNHYGAKLMLPSPSPTLTNYKRLILIREKRVREAW